MEIPAHLQAWVVEQRPELYTPIDHALWRYILRVNRSYFLRAAHPGWCGGLEATGIPLEHIPRIGEMDRRMRAIGWRAVAVSGFIPPQVFMEFQSLGILPIACDMRKLEHALYTPAPDVVHEAAGHAPLIADRAYGDFLRAFGAVSRQAIHSRQDMAVFRAIRRLSEVKEDPAAPAGAAEEAQTALDGALAAVDWVSEAAQLSRLYWWTVEYGLVGPLDEPRIYGAGLLSSAGESWRCLDANVEKRPLDALCVHQGYDITRPQPWLYVTPDFEHLFAVLEEVAAGLACRTGGRAGLEKALRAQAPVTVELDSGVQVGGVLQEMLLDEAGEPCWLRFDGPALLAEGDVELPGQGREAHAHGFSLPLGELAGRGGGVAALDTEDLRALGFSGGGRGTLRFASGVELRGRLEAVREGAAGNQLLTFTDCRVSLGDRLLFDPAWGVFDLACGVRVAAVRGGWPDGAVDAEDLPVERPAMKCNLDDSNRGLCDLYARLRAERESGRPDGHALEEIARELDARHPDDWLLRLELLELGEASTPARREALRERLAALGAADPLVEELVSRGLALCD